MPGLSVNDAVTVEISLSQALASVRNFGALLVLGDADVITVGQRIREYTSADAVELDFPSLPEFAAADLFFSQNPQPELCYVGRWASTATHGILQGGPLNVAAQAMANFTAITNGVLDVVVDGTAHNINGLSFAAQTNLNGVAALVQGALGGAATCVWNANNGYFIVESATTGAASSVAFASVGSGGIDLSVLMGLGVNSGGIAAAGVAAESLVSAVATLANMSTDWYGLQIASTVAPAQADILAVAALIQGLTVTRIFGYTTSDPNSLSATSTTDTLYLLQQAGYSRTFCQYSSTTKHASAATFGIAFTVDFTGVDTTLTLKFKTALGVTAETLTETQAAALTAKNGLVAVNYDNGSAILQQGCMVNGTFFDVIHGTDWLQNAVQTDIWDLFLSKNKVPQTDPGVTALMGSMIPTFEESVGNGLVAPGVWQGNAFGGLKTGDTLTKGYYLWAPSVASQSQPDRAARKAPLIQAAVKLAGAFHSASVLVNVNS